MVFPFQLGDFQVPAVNFPGVWMTEKIHRISRVGVMIAIRLMIVMILLLLYL